MKKSIVLLMILSTSLFSCDRVLRKPDSKLATPSGLLKDNLINSELAIKMIAHYRDSIVNHSLDAIIKQITLYNSDFYQIFKEYPNTTRIKLMPAAYLDDSSVVDTLRNKVTVIIQLKSGYNSDYSYHDINGFGDGRLCPPPPGCIPNLTEEL